MTSEKQVAVAESIHSVRSITGTMCDVTYVTGVSGVFGFAGARVPNCARVGGELVRMCYGESYCTAKLSHTTHITVSSSESEWMSLGYVDNFAILRVFTLPPLRFSK